MKKAAIGNDTIASITIPAGRLYVDVPALRMRFYRGDEYQLIKATAIPLTISPIQFTWTESDSEEEE